MKKSRVFDFKKGDQVVFLTESYGKVRLEEGVVLMVRTAMDIKRYDGRTLTLPVVYVQFKNRHWGDTYSKKFCDQFGTFQEDPYPLWRLRHLNNGEMKGLEKRATHASKLHQVYVDKSKEIEVEVDIEARDWKYREQDRRKSALPHSGMYLRNVVARMGFKRPET